MFYRYFLTITFLFNFNSFNVYAKSNFKIENGQAEINYATLRLQSPDSEVIAGVKGAACGSVAGLILSCEARNGSTILINTLTCALIGAIIQSIRNYRYSNVYDKADGYNLYGAAAQNNTEGVEALINYGEKPLGKDNEGRIPLHFAAATGSNEALEVLLEKQPSTYTIIEGVTVTKSVSEKKHSAIAAGIDVVLGTNWYKAPAKIETVATAEIQKIISSTDIQDKQGNTALHLAALCNKADTVKLLMAHGADARLQNKFEQTVSTIAANKPLVEQAIEEIKAGV